MFLDRIFRKKIFAFLVLFSVLLPCLQAQNNHYRKKARYNTWQKASNSSMKKTAISSNDLLYLLRNGENYFGKLTVKNLHRNDFWQYGKLFQWTSSGKDAARYYSGKGRKSSITFAGKNFAEAILFFEKGKFSRLYVSVFNEGDETGTSYTRNTFKRTLEQMESAVNIVTGQKAVSGRQKLKRHESIHYYSWTTPEYTLKLMWSGSKNPQGGASYCYGELSAANTEAALPEDYRSESHTSYAGKSPGSRNKSNTPITSSKVKKADLVKKVKKKDNRTLIPDIPMVDQGPKGYCVPAVLERVMMYYGVIINQHVLAGLMKSSAAEGTSTANMYLALKRLSKKLNINVRRQYEYFRTVSELESFVSKYNSIAKKEKASRIRVIKFGEKIDLEKTLLSVDPEIGRRASLQLKKKGFNKNFSEFIKENIDAGIPVIWSVLLTLSPEKNVARGGHLRLIIGYETEDGLMVKTARQTRGSKKTSGKITSVVFSDTWGRGHEAKTMEAEDAWAITTGLYYIEPDN
ncbi:MAG: hypothetical protein J6S53_00300 [Lentisphaeria bacterium]|nr:hypothetical protein [Lentisphaeria bacterium]